MRLARLQLTAEERRWEHGLLVRRSRHDPTELADDVVLAPAGTSLRTLRTLGRVAGQRWRSEQSGERAKGAVGLDPYEVRRWDGWSRWSRQMTVALFALASLAVLRAQLHAQLHAQEQAQEQAQHVPAPARRPSHTTGQTSKTPVAKGGRTSSRSIGASPSYR